jgi:DNA-binding LacI/PurR family transcriptional regulator
VQHLWESGCRQIGYLLNGISNSTLNLRQQGFLKALSEKNIVDPETHIVEIPKKFRMLLFSITKRKVF